MKSTGRGIRGAQREAASVWSCQLKLTVKQTTQQGHLSSFRSRGKCRFSSSFSLYLERGKREGECVSLRLLIIFCAYLSLFVCPIAGSPNATFELLLSHWTPSSHNVSLSRSFFRGILRSFMASGRKSFSKEIILSLLLQVLYSYILHSNFR